MKTAEDVIKDQKHDVITVPPDTIIKSVLQTMTQHAIGAILVKEAKEIIGIWTERDLMRNVLDKNFDLDSSLIRDYMTKKLVYANHDDSIFQLQDKFLGLKIRHLLVKHNNVFVGMVSSGDVTKYGLNEKTEELKGLNKIINWEYYENWHW